MSRHGKEREIRHAAYSDRESLESALKSQKERSRGATVAAGIVAALLAIVAIYTATH